MLHDHYCAGDDRQPGQRQHATPPIPPWNKTGFPVAVRSRSNSTRHTCTGRAIFLTVCSPRSSVSERELVPDLFVDCARDANTAWVRETLKPRRDVDPITIDLIALDHYVAEVDADAELHPALWRQLCVLSFERGLNIRRAIHRLDDAGELSKNTISGRVYEAAVVLRD